MIGWVTRHMLPDLSGVPYLHVNRPESSVCNFLCFLPKVISFRECSKKENQFLRHVAESNDLQVPFFVDIYNKIP